MKCNVGEKKIEALQAQLSSGSNDGEAFGAIDFDQLQIENSQLQEKIDSRNNELLALKQATAMTLTRLNSLKQQLNDVLTETAWLKNQKGQKMLAIDKVAALSIIANSMFSDTSRTRRCHYFRKYALKA
jgi:hypothetical protein